MVVRSRGAEPTTAGERLFVEYLRTRGLRHRYEPPTAGKRKNPDFEVTVGDGCVYCEVKDLHGDEQPRRASAFNPYLKIRAEIKKSRRQFGEFKDYPCVLVLHNVSEWRFSHDPPILLGAMLGDLGIACPVDPSGAATMTPTAWQEVFLQRGAMRFQNPQAPGARATIHNTTISAVAVLNEFDLHNPAFEPEFRRRVDGFERREGRQPSEREWIGLRMALYGEIPLAHRTLPRVIVVDNPVARLKVPDSMFAGSCDARYRWNPVTGQIQRVFAGADLAISEEIAANGVIQRLEKYYAVLVREFKPSKVILFGSRAAGSARSDSDVDLLVIFPGDGDISARSLDIRRRIPCDFPLDLVVRSEGELKRRLKQGDTFLQSILDEGRVIYAA